MAPFLLAKCRLMQFNPEWVSVFAGKLLARALIAWNGLAQYQHPHKSIGEKQQGQ